MTTDKSKLMLRSLADSLGEILSNTKRCPRSGEYISIRCRFQDSTGTWEVLQIVTPGMEEGGLHCFQVDRFRSEYAARHYYYRLCDTYDLEAQVEYETDSEIRDDYEPIETVCLV
jgi:hypothetical protein